MQRTFSRLDDRKLLALAISSLQDLAKEYLGIANVLEDKFPASARVFVALAAEKNRAAEPFSVLLQEKFSLSAAFLQRYQVAGLPLRSGGWLMRSHTDKMRRKQNIVLDALRAFAEISEIELLELAERAAVQVQDPAISQAFGSLAETIGAGPTPSARLGLRYQEPKGRHVPATRQWLLWREATRSAIRNGAILSFFSLAPILAVGTRNPTSTLVMFVALVAGLSGGLFAGAATFNGANPFYGLAQAILSALLSGLTSCALALAVALPYCLFSSPVIAEAFAAGIALAEVLLIAHSCEGSTALVPSHTGQVLAAAGTTAITIGILAGLWWP